MNSFVGDAVHFVRLCFLSLFKQWQTNGFLWKILRREPFQMP